MSVLNILNELANEPSTNVKVEILKANHHSEDLKRVFLLAYDNTNFYIKKIPETSTRGTKSLSWGLNNLATLSNRTLTGHAGIAHLGCILENVSEEDAEVIARVVGKDLRCGTSDSLASKVWKELDISLPVMLAQPMKDKFIQKIKYPAFAQLKSDGARCICIIDNNANIKLVSRNNKEYHGLDFLKSQIHRTFASADSQLIGNVVLDGELLVVDNGNTLPRQISNGIINKSSKNTISEDESKKVVFVVWDIIPYAEYFSGVCNTTYDNRFANLQLLMNQNSHVTIIENHEVNSLVEAKVVFQKYVSDGLEGIILKNKAGIWKDTRSNDQVKFKVEIMSDLICTDIIEGTGKYEGMLGALVCKTRDGLVNVNVGSGFNENQRVEYWEDKNLIINKIVEVKHNGVITASSGNSSLFLPIFQYIREDKTLKDADTLESIDG